MIETLFGNKTAEKVLLVADEKHRLMGTITDGDKIIGSRHRVKVVKNKVAPPFRIAELDIMNEGGISQSGSVLDVGVEMGVIQKSGSFFKYKGKVLGQGREAVKIVFTDDVKLQKEIEQEIWKVVKEGQKLPPEVGEKQE